MGFFSKKKNEKKEEFNNSLLKVLINCPSCSEKSFFPITKVTLGTSIYPNTKLVGEQTGFCSTCGLICHGQVYLDGAGYSIERLMELAFMNNIAAFDWFENLIRVSKNGGDHEQAYLTYMNKIREIKGDDISIAKTDWFIGKCLNYFIETSKQA